MTSGFVALAIMVLGAVAPSAVGAVTYATEVDWNGKADAGWDGNGVASQSRKDTDNALGAPDQVGVNSVSFLSLGRGNTAVFGFGTLFRGVATVFEVTYTCLVGGSGFCTNYPEEVQVYAGTSYAADSFDLSGFDYIGAVRNGSAQGGASFALGGIYSYLAFVDASPAGANRDGFDIDSVWVEAVPVPGAAVLMASALAGLALTVAVRRRA